MAARPDAETQRKLGDLLLDDHFAQDDPAPGAPQAAAAVQQYRAVLAAQPAYARTDEVLVSLGEALRQTGDAKEAMATWRRLVKDFPKSKAAGDGWLGIASSLWGLILVHIIAGLPSTTLFFRNYYVGLPDELVKAAMLDGAGFWRIFWRIILPLSTPITVVTLIWQFTNIWNDFLYGIVFTGADSKPVTVGLNNLANTTSSVKEYNVDMAAALIAALPTLFVYVVAGNYFVRGLTAGAVKG